MRVVDLIKSTDKTAFSFEILPPLKGTGIEKLYKTVDTLREFDPKYINITTHRSEYVYKDLGNGLYQRARMRRRPGTVAVAAALQNKYNITTVPHILCSGFTREDTEYVLLDLQFLGITDLLVLGCAVPLKEVIIGEGLQTRGFADCQTAALLKIRVNEIMAILRNMRCDGRGGMIIQLDAETIRKLHGF